MAAKNMCFNVATARKPNIIQIAVSAIKIREIIIKAETALHTLRLSATC